MEWEHVWIVVQSKMPISVKRRGQVTLTTENFKKAMRFAYTQGQAAERQNKSLWETVFGSKD